MEWVQTSGKTIDEAKERALDELGVDDRDAEFEVLEEPRSGLFGLTRGDAKVRARVRPTSPRPKQERGRRRSGSGGRDRSRSGGGNGGRSRSSRGGGNGGNGGSRSRSEVSDRAKDRDQDRKQDDDSDRSRSGGGNGGGRGGGRSRGNDGGGRNRSSRNEGGRERSRDNDRPKEDKGEPMTEASVQEQAAAAEEFLSGLVEAFGLTADVSSEEVDEAVEVRIDGNDLGLLIGPKGRTLWALQELTKTVVQRQQGGGLSTRIRVDVAGYRERRKVALERFTQDAAAAVLDSGQARALEPMGAADRKVVHDTVNDIEGVVTRSEGEDPRRRVVIAPE